MALTPMTVLWFSPGVVHRLINDGGLQILVVMQNGGLPEAGDSVLTFPPEYLAEDSAYRAIASPAPPGAMAPEEAAHRRQQLAVQGFLRLREQVQRDGPIALDAFYAAAAALVRDRVPAWRELWTDGALAAALRTSEHLDLLSKGQREHLSDGQLSVIAAPAGRSYGMCGRLLSFPAAPLQPAPGT
jgi:hypothetical protein